MARSTQNIYHRFSEHVAGEKTNVRLWRSIQKYGLGSFSFQILEFLALSNNITDIETSYISKVPVDILFNFKTLATSILGYKHTEEAREKIRKRFIDKQNHPMYKRQHTPESLLLISKPGVLNPIYGKTHSVETRDKISQKISKGEVSCYDVNINF